MPAEWATVLFVIQLSLGEAIWSPRWYDYSMSVAPEGREGVFTAMASAPLFLGKFVTGKYIAVGSAFKLAFGLAQEHSPVKQGSCCRQRILELNSAILAHHGLVGILAVQGHQRADHNNA